MKKLRPLRVKGMSLDMTAMADVAFLLLCFFVVTARFQQWEPMKINSPAITNTRYHSIYDAVATIYIADNRVMYQITGDKVCKLTLEEMGQLYHVTFSREEQDEFVNAPIIGAPIAQLKQYDKQYMEWEKPTNRPGIPLDTISDELFNWVRESRRAEMILDHRALLINIKADKNVGYPIIKQVMRCLEKQKVSRIEFISPEATPQYFQ